MVRLSSKRWLIINRYLDDCPFWPAVPDDTAVVENFLELGGGFFTLPGREIRLAANVGGIEAR